MVPELREEKDLCLGLQKLPNCTTFRPFQWHSDTGTMRGNSDWKRVVIFIHYTNTVLGILKVFNPAACKWSTVSHFKSFVALCKQHVTRNITPWWVTAYVKQELDGNVLLFSSCWATADRRQAWRFSKLVGKRVSHSEKKLAFSPSILSIRIGHSTMHGYSYLHPNSSWFLGFRN